MHRLLNEVIKPKLSKVMDVELPPNPKWVELLVKYKEEKASSKTQDCLDLGKCLCPLPKVVVITLTICNKYWSPSGKDEVSHTEDLASESLQMMSPSHISLLRPAFHCVNLRLWTINEPDNSQLFPTIAELCYWSTGGIEPSTTEARCTSTPEMRECKPRYEDIFKEKERVLQLSHFRYLPRFHIYFNFRTVYHNHQAIVQSVRCVLKWLSGIHRSVIT